MASETLIDIFWERVVSSPDRPAVLHKLNGSYKATTWQEQGLICSKIASALISFHISKLDTLCIMSTSCPKWTWSDISILSSGAVTVPIYPSLNAEEAGYILEHCQAQGLFLENQRQLHKLLGTTKDHNNSDNCETKATNNIPSSVKFIVLFEEKKQRVQEIQERQENTERKAEDETRDNLALPIYSFAEFLALGEKNLASNENIIKKNWQNILPDDLATIVYTSGTTGVPKGVCLTHKNIYFVCQALSTNIGFHPDDLALSFLPLSHIFERIGGQFLSIYEGITTAYAESMDTVALNILEVQPTIMNAVPRFYEKAYNKIQSQIRKMPTAQQYLIRWALSIGLRALKNKENNINGKAEIASKIYKTELRVAEKIVFSKIRQRLGGRFRFLVSGAAPLSTEVHQFFESIGIPILEGYGLTETTAPLACNRPGSAKRGTVGKALPGVAIKIAPDGEILVRGPNVFKNYYKNPEATKNAFTEDGWFMTGDIGELSEDGYLRIKDRKKDIIITAGGKHIAPQVLENKLVGKGLISRALIYGDRRKYISTLLTLNHDELKNFANIHSISYSSTEELCHHPKVLEDIEIQIKQVNTSLASFEQIKKFIILENDFSIEANELTPTMKLKRKFVSEKYKELLDSMYEKEDLLLENSK